MADDTEGLRERLTRQGEDTIGKLAQDLLENPLVNSAITRAFDAREKAAQAQEAAFSALNIPSAADIERLTRRVRRYPSAWRASRTASIVSTSASPACRPAPATASIGDWPRSRSGWASWSRSSPRFRKRCPATSRRSRATRSG